MSRLLKKQKTERLGFGGFDEIKQHSFFKECSTKNVYYTDEDITETLKPKLEKNIDSLLNLYGLREKAAIKDYVKVFTFFCFYKIFRIKLFKDGLIQFCYPKEKRVWKNYMVMDIKRLNIEGPKSLQVIFMDEVLSLEVFLKAF